MSCKVFAVINTKGGVGKTTFTANLGGILADMGRRVLLIDADFQPSLSSHYHIKSKSENGLTKFITSLSADSCISKTEINNLDIIVSDDPDATLVTWLRQSGSHFLYLAAAIESIKKSDQYDYVLIDSEGVSKSELQESVIVAADILLAPVIPDYKPAREFARGMIRTLNRIQPPKGIETPYSIPPMMVFFNAKDRTNDNDSVVKELQNEFRCGAFQDSQFDISLMNTLIPDISAYNKACGLHLPVHRVEKKRYNSSTLSAFDTMKSFAHELCPELSNNQPIIPSESPERED